MPGPSNQRKARKRKAAPASSHTAKAKVLRDNEAPNSPRKAFFSDDALPPPSVVHELLLTDAVSIASPDVVCIIEQPKRAPFSQVRDIEAVLPLHPLSPNVVPRRDIAAIVEAALTPPFIHDSGNGPRVRDVKTFLASSFAQSPAMDVPICAEFAQDEIGQMLCSLLPEEIALILWYNKSRSTSRICPSCQRLYRLGDMLPDLLPDEEEFKHVEPHVPLQLGREQELSGLCSPVCFILAAINFPGAIKSAWGCTEDELTDEVWDMLNVHTLEQDDKVAASLGLLVRMTRLHDLGLAQLCFP